MPAVEPFRIARQAVEIASSLDQPGLFRRRLRGYLETHAEKVRRPKPPDRSKNPARTFGTSRQALNALEASFRARTAASSEVALLAAEALWEEGSGESCRLACLVLGDHASQEVFAWVEGKALMCDDPATLAELGKNALRSWSGQHAEAFLRAAAGWLTHESRPQRTLALCALGAGVSDLSHDELSSVISLLRGQAANAVGEGRSALIEVVQRIAVRSPGEAVHFLLDELASGAVGVDRLAMETIDAFPEAQKLRLLAALSESTPAGIMPAHSRLDRHGR
jgi:hypothetical protein